MAFVSAGGYFPPSGTEEHRLVSSLRKLKVYEVSGISTDPYRCETFEDVVSAVEIETDLFEEEALNDSYETYREHMGNLPRLDMRSYRSALKWLDEARKVVDRNHRRARLETEREWYS